jgi:hypothetical protein
MALACIVLYPSSRGNYVSPDVVQGCCARETGAADRVGKRETNEAQIRHPLPRSAWASRTASVAAVRSSCSAASCSASRSAIGDPLERGGQLAGTALE